MDYTTETWKNEPYTRYGRVGEIGWGMLTTVSWPVWRVVKACWHWKDHVDSPPTAKTGAELRLMVFSNLSPMLKTYDEKGPWTFTARNHCSLRTKYPRSRAFQSYEFSIARSTCYAQYSLRLWHKMERISTSSCKLNNSQHFTTGANRTGMHFKRITSASAWMALSAGMFMYDRYSSKAWDL